MNIQLKIHHINDISKTPKENTFVIIYNEDKTQYHIATRVWISNLAGIGETPMWRIHEENPRDPENSYVKIKYRLLEDYPYWVEIQPVNEPYLNPQSLFVKITSRAEILDL